MIALLVITNGRRDCIAATIPSALDALHGPVTRRIVVDDSGDPTYQQWIGDSFPTFELVTTEGSTGFDGVYRFAWQFVTEFVEEPFVFNLEDDFTFNHPVFLRDMVTVLDSNPHLAQLALRRQPWNDQERKAGGIVEQHPDDYAEQRDRCGHEWLEHRRFWTTNPNLHRSSTCALGWPEGGDSEGRFTHRLLEQHDLRFGFWGARDSGEWVRHIGDQRVGSGY